MKEKVKVKRMATKSEAAKLLREIADQVESGNVTIDNFNVTLPESFECELEYKEKDYKKQVEIEFQWK